MKPIQATPDTVAKFHSVGGVLCDGCGSLAHRGYHYGLGASVQRFCQDCHRQNKGNKYGARRVEIAGERFDSQKEAARWLQLSQLEQANEITGLRRQVRLPIAVNGVTVCTYVCDFVYLDKRDCIVVYEDVKGMATAVYKLKKKLVRAVYGIDIHET